MESSDSKGFTIIEALIVVAVVSVLAALAAPRLMRARISGNEASAIASVRTISSAEESFASTCGGGGYAVTLTDLALPPPNSGVGFIPADLAAATAGGMKHGYGFLISGGTGTSVMAAASTCNGAINASETEFFATASPLAAGVTGVRFFALDESGQIRQDTVALSDMTDGVPLQ